MLQRLARSRRSVHQLWTCFSSVQECGRACDHSTTAAVGQPVTASLEQRLKRRIREDIANESKTPDPRPVYAGVLIERYPICFPDPMPWQVEHREWSTNWNKWKYRQVTDEQMSADKQNVDEMSAEATFKPEPVITEADNENDIRSLRRSTQGFLYLACRYGYGDDSRWEVPRTQVREGETLRDAAKRCVQEIAGDSIETFFFANAPSGHVETADDRTFYMLGVVLDGDAALSSQSPATDYAWLKRGELAESYKEDDHMSNLVHCLLEE